MAQFQMRWTGWAKVIGGMASLVVLVSALWDFGPDKSLTDESSDEDLPTEISAQFEAWRGQDLLAEPETSELPDGRAFWTLFVDREKAPVDARVLVSAPGMWPFLSMDTTATGHLALPAHEAQTMDGRHLRMYEVLARSRDQDRDEQWGFWGLVHGPAERIEAEAAKELTMAPGYALKVEVVDAEGAPLEGALVRLSRDSVGLLHLHSTTKQDGLANFRAIPAGDYYLTIDADNYRRTTARVEHSGVSELPLSVSLEGGGGLRLPQSWRGPPVPELARASSATDGQESASSSNETGSEEENEGPRSPLKILVADRYGGGVAGAVIEVWADGRRVAQGESGGNTPFVANVPAESDLSLVATHAGWGEGQVRIDAVGDEPVTVRMDQELLSVRAAGDRVLNRREIEAALGIELVDDGRRLLIELDKPQGPAAAAGLARGDALLFVRRQGADYQALVERNGQRRAISVDPERDRR